jgi:DNA-binding NarL/FixJ family response regulator
VSDTDRGIRTTVVVLDPDAEIAESLRQAREVEVVAHVTRSGDLLETLWQTVPDAVVLNVETPDTAVVDLCRRLSDVLPVCRVVLVSSDGDAPFEAAIDGAAAVVGRASLTTDPGGLVQQIARGEAIVSAAWAARALDAFAAEDAPHLTATEREVLGRLAKGTTSEAVAGLHEVPGRLVRLHAAYAMAKLHRAARARRVDAEAG